MACLDLKPVCCFGVRPTWLPQDAAQVLTTSTQFFDRPTSFTDWLCVGAWVEDWPQVPLVLGWREAKPCAKAIAAVRCGDTSGLRRSKQSPQPLGARRVPFQDVVVIAESQCMKAVVGWAQEQTFGITVHAAGSMAELSMLLQAVMSKATMARYQRAAVVEAVPRAWMPGCRTAAPPGLELCAATPQCPTVAAPPPGLELPDGNVGATPPGLAVGAAPPGLACPHAFSAPLQVVTSKPTVAPAQMPGNCTAAPEGLEPCVAQPCLPPPPGLPHPDGDAGATPPGLAPPHVSQRYAADPLPLSDPDVQSYLVARLALLRRELSEAAQEQKPPQRNPKDPFPLSDPDVQSYLMARLVLLQRERSVPAQEEESCQLFPEAPCKMNDPDDQGHAMARTTSPKREGLASAKEQELSKRLASMALSNPGATLRMVCDVNLPTPWAAKSAAPVMVVPNESLVYL